MYRARVCEIVTPDPANAKTVASFRTKAAASASAAREDATFEFANETKSPDGDRRETVAAKAVPPLVTRKSALVVVAAVLGLLAVSGGVWAALELRPAGVPMGSLNVESDPPGAEVLIDESPRGTTPLSITLPEGTHTLVVQHGSNVKRLDVEVASAIAKSYHVAWAEPLRAPAAPATGSLSIVSDPPGSAVIVDGAARGQTPLTIRELAAGRHEVLVRGTNTTYQRSVEVEPGGTASLVVGGGTAAAAPAWGWITLRTPFTVQVLEAGRVVGTSEVDRILLPPGGHELEFVSDVFGFRQSSKVTVTAGRGETVSLAIPRAPMNINALPWAEVFVDGTRIGDTPLANVMQPIGDHELVFRHPQYGEKRQPARLTLKDPLRVSVDMRSP
jgi:hypothetical protein